ncbi:hypothetical protein [Pimelobacter simplex]|uniref:hypothetical protein n=3 Tax=Nocardioides simplex TaxID=2045 RepID=UPI0008E49F9A|nr:hypothetical protein [Pimelobacter simplex]SFM50180.1 hypothetical protein SAMN05421671_1984 [Pimelobacter simplex]
MRARARVLGTLALAATLVGTGAATGPVSASGGDPGPDVKPPTIAFAAPVSPWGSWYGGNVPVRISVEDNVGGSGVAGWDWTLTGAQTGSGSSTGVPATVTVTQEGLTTITVVATDNEGNSATRELPVSIDRTAPEITFATVVPEGASVNVGFGYTFSYGCHDVRTIVASCTGSIPSGGVLPTSTAGPHQVVVQATDIVGNTTQRVFRYTVVNGPLTAVAPPTISGTAKVGFQLVATGGQFTPQPDTVGYRWERDGVPVGSGASYVLRPADAGARLRVVATGHKAGWDDTAQASTATPVVVTGELLVSGVPEVVGETRLGATLSVRLPTIDPRPDAVTYTWLRGDTVVGHDATYRAGPDDVGATLRARLTYAAAGYTPRSQETAARGPVTGGLVVSAAPRITGPARVGATLSATPGAYAPAATGSSRQWLRDGLPIAGATGRSYRLTAADAGHRVVVRETGVRAGWDGVAAESAATAPVLRAVATGRATATVRKRTVRLRVALTAPGVVPTGSVVVRRGGTAVRGTWTLRNGVAEIVLRKQPRGRQRYAVRYAGDAAVAPLPLAVVRVRIP